MKIFVFLTLFIGSAVSSAKINNGGNVGNGGDPIALEFLQNANKVIEDVFSDLRSYPEVKNVDLRATLQKIKVVITEETLWVEVDGRKQVSTAVNFPATNTVVINRALWYKIATRERKLSLVFHEILGLVGLEKSGDYSISQRYKDKNLENTELIITRSSLPLIPANAISCYQHKTTPSDQASVPDVAGSYFRIPRMHFFRSNSSKDLVIAMIRVTYALPSDPGRPSEIAQCVYGGDQLRALSSKWWNKSEAIIPANQGTVDNMFSTDCALYCGGIQTKAQGFVATADVDVYGFERNPVTGDETPVKLNRTIQIEGF